MSDSPPIIASNAPFPSYYIVKQKPEPGISLLSVHDHGFKQGTVNKHTFNHAMYRTHEVDVGGLHHLDFGSRSRVLLLQEEEEEGFNEHRCRCIMRLSLRYHTRCTRTHLRIEWQSRLGDRRLLIQHYIVYIRLAIPQIHKHTHLPKQGCAGIGTALPHPTRRA